MEKVSVIIPVYNVEAFLDACIDSVVNQTYRELEIIAVDDGSPDNSGKILDEWAEKDSRIIVIHKKNGGLSSARNAALDIATGDYIAMIDSDDFWERDAIEHLVFCAKKADADMVVARGRRVDLKGNEFSEIKPGKYAHKEGLISEEEFWESRYIDMFYIVAWSKLYRKEIFEDIRFPEGKINEDVGVLWKVLGKCKRIFASEKKIYNWRETPGSITRTKFGYKNFYLAHAHLDEIEYLKKAGASEKVMYLAYNNAFLYLTSLLDKTYTRLQDPAQIKEADELYRQYKPIARKLIGLSKYSKDNFFKVLIKKGFFCICKSGYLALHRIIVGRRELAMQNR